jgi:hypothetical protein
MVSRYNSEHLVDKFVQQKVTILCYAWHEFLKYWLHHTGFILTLVWPVMVTCLTVRAWRGKPFIFFDDINCNSTGILRTWDSKIVSQSLNSYSIRYISPCNQQRHTGGVKVLFYFFFNLGACCGGWFKLRPGRFTPRKETLYLFYRRLGGRGIVWNFAKSLPPPGFDLRTFHPLPDCYTNSAISDHL